MEEAQFQIEVAVPCPHNYQRTDLGMLLVLLYLGKSKTDFVLFDKKDDFSLLIRSIIKWDLTL